MPNAVDIFWRLPSDRLDVVTVKALAGLAFARHRLDDRELLALVPSMRWNQNYYPGALWARRK